MFPFVVSRSFLIATKKKAIRNGFWFKVLNKTERDIMNLAIKLVSTVKSLRLRLVLREITLKIPPFADFMYNLEFVGSLIAKKYSRLAFCWGNKEALNWQEDATYFRFLGLSKLNSMKGRERLFP